jgi:isoleucyl-tRNA synthetase
VTVGLTIKLTEELLQEGIVRDVIRQVQTMRKNANFAVEDRIIIYMDIEGTMKDAIHSFEELFKNEVLATEIYYEFNEGDFSDKFVMNGQEVQFGLKRVKI